MYARHKSKNLVSRIILQRINKKQSSTNQINKNIKFVHSQVNPIISKLNRFDGAKKYETIQKTAGTGKFLKSYEGYTRHHIIPESTLEAFYRNVKAVSNGINDKELHNAIKKLLYEQYQNIKFSKDLQETKRQKFYTIPSQDILYDVWLNNKDNPKLVNLLSDLNEILIWFPANLVIGPMNRPNDPGNRFDEEACKYSNNKNKSYFKTTYEKMSVFNAENRNSTLGNYNNLTKEIIVLQDRLKRVMGEQETAKKRQIHNDGLQYKNPFYYLEPVSDDFDKEINKLHSEIEMKKELMALYNEKGKQIMEIAGYLTKILEGGKEMTDARKEDWSA